MTVYSSAKHSSEQAHDLLSAPRLKTTVPFFPALKRKAKTMHDVVIRPLRQDDYAQWLPLWQGYQTFYKVSIADEVSALTWARFFEELVPMHAFVAEQNGTLLGMVHYIFHYSTWTAGPYVYLQDLFTNEAARGKGVGTALIKAVYEKSAGAGASRVYWLTHESNETAISLYRKVADQSGFIQFRKIMG